MQETLHFSLYFEMLSYLNKKRGLPLILRHSSGMHDEPVCIHRMMDT